MKRCLPTNFLLCGLCGWCMECFWTGLHALHEHKDPTLICTTSIWMFPIYGMAAFISPISKKLKKYNALIRGGVYTIFIFATEFGSGKILKKFRACPWDYKKAKLNFKGIIRFDYAPIWFIVGLIFEKILKPQKN